MPIELSDRKAVIEELNRALAWEFRASMLYAHYAAYVKGMESLQLEELFKEESTESMGHAEGVRNIIADLGGEAVTTRDPTPIVHSEDTGTMLEEALKTEQRAAEAYEKILPMLKEYYPFWHTIAHILQDELNAVIEFERLLGR